MKLIVFSILDVVAGVYCRPFVGRSDAEGQRIFAHMCEADETVSKAPSDYRLYRLGTFDEVGGELVGERARQLMAGSTRLEATAENGRRVTGGLRKFLSRRGS